MFQKISCSFDSIQTKIKYDNRNKNNLTRSGGFVNFGCAFSRQESCLFETIRSACLKRLDSTCAAGDRLAVVFASRISIGRREGTRKCLRPSIPRATHLTDPAVAGKV